ncbi:type VI secretion protein [Pseudomonas oryzihabitans]|uniref:type VI secretion protein n=1 Tax=Pseudomonas oryzihabitans TaxID=47885 RepID=UPI002895B4AC|nr:type VI secretion protein [Pseudomonas oryzihabitans]MDT3717922.1 type VI secretion protein [Pseudomonas oryzihabitans]
MALSNHRFLCRHVFFSCLLLFSGCAFFGSRVALNNVTIEVERNANGNSPVSVDFVATPDATLTQSLKGLTASQWFAQREQLQRDNPGRLDVWSLEVVPEQFAVFRDIPLHGVKAQDVLVYANYSTPGAHRLLITTEKRIWLKLDAREMQFIAP